MKKILVVLLVFAVAGGVFAQESNWTLGAGVQLSTDLDFGGTPDVFRKDANDVGNKGTLGAAWERDGLKVSLDFEVNPADIYGLMNFTDTADSLARGGVGKVDAAVSYDAGNYAFFAKAPLSTLLSGGNSNALSELWGWYKFVNEMVHLEAAYKGRDNGWWGSADFVGGGWANLNGMSGILANVAFSGLDFGIMVPNLYQEEGAPGWQFNSSGFLVPYSPTRLVDDALLKSVFGFKFVMAPIEFAAQFKFENYGIYFGGKWSVNEELAISLNFKSDDATSGIMGAGLKAEYTATDFGAAVAFVYRMGTGQIPVSVEPSFWYNVLPSYLQFGVDAGFYFGEDLNGQAINWKIAPKLSWNFLGDGAQGMDPMKTGIGLQYVVDSRYDASVASRGTNGLYVGFKWGF